jgi:5-hydroxyisourate hydrolase
MSQVTSHVLDAALGRPAEGVPVGLYNGAGLALASGVTNSDGRVAELGPAALDPGVYRLVFDTATYFTASGQTGFYPRITIDFEITDATSHYHVPVLLSPFAYSTYRGS